MALEAEVSTSTVSLFIRGHAGVAEHTGQRIAEAIERLNYVPRPRAQKGSKDKLVGLLVESLPNPAFSDIYYGEVILGLQEAANDHGYSLLFATVDDDQLPPMVANELVAGLLLVGGSPTNLALEDKLHATELPMVLVDHYRPTLPVHAFVPDDLWGGYLAFNHLLSLGHERIAIIEGPPKYRTLTDRLQGALQAAEEAGHHIAEGYQQKALSTGRLQKGYLEMKQLLALPEPPTALFAVSDKTALGAYECIKEAGLKIPHDISVIGFDDAAQTEPRLTTIHVPRFEMGRLAMQQMLALIEESDTFPTRTCLHTHLVVRDSTAPPPGS